MEGANEAARRAVNAILDAHRLARDALRGLHAARAARCWRPRAALDELRWRLFHRPARSPLQVSGDGGLEPRNAALAGDARRRDGSVGDAGEARLAAARLERLEPERLHRPERAGAPLAPAAGAAQAMMPAVSAYGSAPGELHLGELRAGGVVGLADDPRDARRPAARPAPPSSTTRSPTRLHQRRARPAPSSPPSRPGCRPAAAARAPPNQPR